MKINYSIGKLKSEVFVIVTLYLVRKFHSVRNLKDRLVIYIGEPKWPLHFGTKGGM